MKKRITQQRLATAGRVSQQSINKYESHSLEPDIHPLNVIADFFHTYVDYLIGQVYEADVIREFRKFSNVEMWLINDTDF